MRKIHKNLPHKNIFKLSIKTGVPGFIELLSITDRAVFECRRLWHRNKSRKKPVLNHGSYLAFFKHSSITDRAVLEDLFLNSTSGWDKKTRREYYSLLKRISMVWYAGRMVARDLPCYTGHPYVETFSYVNDIVKKRWMKRKKETKRGKHSLGIDTNRVIE